MIQPHYIIIYSRYKYTNDNAIQLSDYILRNDVNGGCSWPSQCIWQIYTLSFTVNCWCVNTHRHRHQLSQFRINSPLWSRSIAPNRVSTRVWHSSITRMSTKSLIGSTRLFEVDDQRILQDLFGARSRVWIVGQQWTDKICLQTFSVHRATLNW